MKYIDVAALSSAYAVRALGRLDVGLVYALCAGNPQFYRYSASPLSEEGVVSDMTIAPPGIPPAQKYYVGFFDGDALVAVMDLIDGYPDGGTAFIGFFMVEKSRQGRGVGGAIIAEVLDHLAQAGYTAARLAIDDGNPQSTAFWKKCGFALLKRLPRDKGWVWLAERKLG